MTQTISNIRPQILLTINKKSTGSIDELRIICQGSLYTHCCRTSPLLQLGFLDRISRLFNWILHGILSGVQDGGKRAMYTPNSLQRCRRMVCSRKHAIVFISVVVSVIVAIAAMAAFAHPSCRHCQCSSPATSAQNESGQQKSTVEPLLSTNGKPFPWTSIRLPDSVHPLSYELFIHPNLSTFRFDGKVTMSLSVDKQTDFLLFHAKSVTISSYELFEVSVEGQTGNRVGIVEALECVKLELFHLQLASNMEPQKQYKLKVEYSGKLTDSLTGFYRSSYETRSGEKR